MSARKVNVTVVRSVEHTAEVAIDQAEYLCTQVGFGYEIKVRAA